MTFPAASLTLLLAFVSVSPAQAARGRGPSVARDLLVAGKLGDALVEYKKILDKKDDPTLRCEYAFALAGLGLRDLALEQLDKAAKEKRFPGAGGAWFRGQILRAAGVKRAEGELGGKAEAPEWFGDGELQDFKAAEGGQLNERFLNANRLAAQGRSHLAAGEFAAALKERPEDVLGWIGYSLALESLGGIETAHQALDKAIPLAEKHPSIQRLILTRRLQLGDPQDRAAQRRKQERQGPGQDAHFLIFAGGSLVNDGASSGSGRFGYFVTPSLDAAIDLNYADFGPKAGKGQRSQVSLGGSMRYYWPVGKKAGAVALGLRLAHTPGYDGAASFSSATVSPGYTSPFGDIFLDLTWHSGGYQVGITVGFTSYFGGGQ